MTRSPRIDGLRRSLPLWAAALWWGSLSVIGFLVVPLLFKHLPSPAMAGAMAGQLFSAQTWLSVVCGLLLLMLSRAEGQGEGAALRRALPYIMAGMLLALLSELAVAPRIMARDNLALWHRVGSSMYLLQWACASAVFWRLNARQA
ncbi:MAG: DUF4149 domain-containing protein [Hylemonella sp.]|nr:DUF4149 domain-containing protein [Hylemonella sp.]